MKIIKTTLAISVGAILTSNPVIEASAAEIAIAGDMNQSSSTNLISYQNTQRDAFSSSADGFQKYQRGVSDSIPFAVLDDSLSTFTGDSLGIIDDNNGDEFFGVTDTVNPDNSEPVSAQWVFDISGAPQLGLSIDIGAMGDFENSDFFTITASIDGGVEQVLIASSVDESGSASYTLAGGSSFELNDPLFANDTQLSNKLKTIRAAIEGTGATLQVTLTASSNGGSEAFAFQNLSIISGFEESEPTGPELVSIADIQGTGFSTELSGEEVIVEGIVVGDYQRNDETDNGDLRGFFLQSLTPDGNPLTSEGIFIFDGSSPSVDVKIGDVVSVIGSVSEFSGMTQVSADSVVVNAEGQPLPEAVSLTLPINDDLDLESVEGMRIILEQPLVISEYFNFDRFGEIVLALPLNNENRLITPTAIEAPGSSAFEQRDIANSQAKITLDDGRTSQNADPAIHPNGDVFSLTNRFRGGDTVQFLNGVMHQAFGAYRIQPTSGAQFLETNPRQSAPAFESDITVASFNVLNYFTTLDENGNRCGPNDSSCRGADNSEEFERQKQKIVAALVDIDADIVGLIEIENNPDVSLKDLTDSVNGVLGSEVYAYVDTGTIGTDAIKVGLIYKQESVETEGAFATIDSSVDSRFIDQLNRPVLLQTFREKQRGGVLSVAVNHLKSKGSDCEDFGDVDMQDGQGNCNDVRNDAAKAFVDWIATDPTNSGDPDVLVIGDLNSYDKEDPILTITSSGFTDLVAKYEGEFAYSYVFDGQVGYLDHALSSSVLTEQVINTQVWHINADEPDIFDYDTSFKKDAQDALFEPNAFRSSDHDPVIVGINLNVVPEDKSQCKKGNWKTLNRHDGSTFKNQGDCVSFVNTGK
ncbi:MAG: hypothetical protein CL600_11865 [Alteromonas sp.]|uniref:ExeM/NucH family extracellular endonuclease n=1 Tax=Alteromonas sp. MB-3u-76 TaxID=2058133 RepID=UPI000C307E17|nr:ExeM/NucH family extracellular endonuclease [Alteromonas sp. MB-3u-76]AUC89303.1 hypothetical protein CW735_14835 [Alteromonas sp. MB-3u-76]MAI65551.1 hypothetical protein [Alteromonas sp.]